MTVLADLEAFSQSLQAAFGEVIEESFIRLDEFTVRVSPQQWLTVALRLRDEFGFEQLIDLCGMDYSTYPEWTRPRFGIVVHLLSVQHNRRLRIKVAAPDGPVPLVDSLVTVWAVANWFEREAFDLFGIVFPGHPDLRRLLTDYGFVGHPFRKDFPVSGFVEMRYDPEQRRVIYQPVSIAPREVIPRKTRPEHYGDTEQNG
ncbi:MAG: NADH-quinone oxidoreductase subunit C [Ferrovum sp.]|nr:NADH-quinone oxidoreductase subunit C [Ferrovum sp.]NDU87318.1 NADH-quinone oxidoreductase subunit C [Ferrovum sp.]